MTVTTSIALTGVAPETLRLWLAAAQTSLHALITGGKAQMVSYSMGDGGQKMVTYTAAQIPQLRLYITELQEALGVRTAGRRRAIGIAFGSTGRSYPGAGCL